MRHLSSIYAIFLSRPSSTYKLTTDQINQCERGEKVLNVVNESY